MRRKFGEMFSDGSNGCERWEKDVDLPARRGEEAEEMGWMR